MDSQKQENHEKAKVYHSQIEPLVQEIRCLCNRSKIPYFFSFGVKLDEDGMYPVPGGLISSVLLPEIIGVPAEDPKFARMVNVVNGFATIADDREPLDIDDLPAPAKMNADHLSIDLSEDAQEEG